MKQMKKQVKVFLFSTFLYPAQQLYRWLFKPKTFGVRTLVWDPQKDMVLMVRHTYGNQSMWHMPGGSLKKKENSQEAALRELYEETGLSVSFCSDGEATNEALGHVPVTALLIYKTEAQGNRDTVYTYLIEAQGLMNDGLYQSDCCEIAEVAWHKRLELRESELIYRVTARALDALNVRLSND